MCRAHATVRGFLGALVGEAHPDRVVIVDMEAGLEHLSRGTARNVSCLLVVLEPYYRSMETARLTCTIGADLGIPRIVAVANKVRDEHDRDAIARFCHAHGVRIACHIPYDQALAEAERAGLTPYDHAPGSPAMLAVRRLAEQLASDGAPL
jgi:CO dehydrogenase maturation factor